MVFPKSFINFMVPQLGGKITESNCMDFWESSPLLIAN